MNLPPELPTGAAIVAITALSGLLARRLAVPHSIVLVLIGAAVAFIPGAPRVELDPALVLLLFLPPLLYSAGVGMSWPGFRDNLPPIALMAVGCVLATACAVAAVAHVVLGLPWAVGFILGAVVSPPDAVAPMAIARRLSVPRRILVVLEGEGLVNDATALILFGFAVAAASGGGVSLVQASRAFAVIVGGEVLWGVAIGWGALRLRRWSASPDVEIVLGLLTPYAAFWVPHALGGSGVLAAVVAGLYVSSNGPRYIAPATRLQGFFVWGLVVYIIEGIVFLLTGLEARVVIQGPNPEEWRRMLFAAVLTIGVVIVVRFLWVFPAAYAPRLLSARMRRRFPAPPWQSVFLISFAGIRGGVSLVAALAIPEVLDGDPFPERDLILFVTFAVIVATLVVLGGALPFLIRRLGLDAIGATEAAEEKRREIQARVAGIDAVLARLDELAAQAPEKAVRALRHYHKERRAEFIETGDETIDGAPAADTALLQAELVNAERASLGQQYRDGNVSDEARRRIERELDLEDARLRHVRESALGAGAGDPA